MSHVSAVGNSSDEDISDDLASTGTRLDSNIGRLAEAALTLNDLSEKILEDLSRTSDAASVSGELATIRAQADAQIAAAQAKAVEADNLARSCRVAAARSEQETSQAYKELAELQSTWEEISAALEASRQAYAAVEQERDAAVGDAHAAEEEARKAHDAAMVAAEDAISARTERDTAQAEAVHARSDADAARHEAAEKTRQCDEAQNIQREREGERDRALQRVKETEQALSAAQLQHTSDIKALEERLTAEHATERATLESRISLLAIERDNAQKEAHSATKNAEIRLADQQASYEQRLAELRSDRDTAQTAARDAERRADALAVELQFMRNTHPHKY